MGYHQGSKLNHKSCIEHYAGMFRQRRGSKQPLSPQPSGLPTNKEGTSRLPDAGPGEADQLIAAATVPAEQTADSAPAQQVAEGEAGAGAAANDVTIFIDKSDSSDQEKFYDAKSTTLPVFGRHSLDAEVIPGPVEAEPQVCHYSCIAVMTSLLLWCVCAQCQANAIQRPMLYRDQHVIQESCYTQTSVGQRHQESEPRTSRT